jgi:hypothetical protein
MAEKTYQPPPPIYQYTNQTQPGMSPALPPMSMQMLKPIVPSAQTQPGMPPVLPPMNMQMLLQSIGPCAQTQPGMPPALPPMNMEMLSQPIGPSATQSGEQYYAQCKLAYSEGFILYIHICCHF